MSRLLSAKQLRSSLPDVVSRVKKGERFTLVYRSEPVMQLVPLGARGEATDEPPTEDPLYGAPALGRSTDGLRAQDHDAVLYGAPRRSRSR